MLKKLNKVLDMVIGSYFLLLALLILFCAIIPNHSSFFFCIFLDSVNITRFILALILIRIAFTDKKKLRQ